MRYTGSMKFVVLFTVLFVTSIILSGCGGPVPPINHSPTIINLISNPPSPIEVNQSTTITCIAFDQDGDTLTYIWTKTGGTISGNSSAITWTAPATAGTYTITCTVSDGELIDSQSILIVVSEPINYPPVISSLTANPSSIDINQTTIITCYATDQDGDTLTYIWTKTGGIISGSGSTITWTAPSTAGTYTITCTVSDGKGGEDSEIVNISVSEINHSPVISSLTANPSSIDINQGSTITCIAYDPDGDTLTYSWTRTGGIISGSGSTITWTAPNVAGTYTITCMVSDNNGGQDSESVNIMANDLGSVPSVSAVAVTYHLYRDKEQSIINKLVKEGKIHQSNPIIKSEKVDKSGITYAIYVEWAKFNEASGYKVYRSVNWTAFKLVHTEEVSSDYEWYGFWDDDTQTGNIYSYYVIAYGPFGETTLDKIVSIDTWLPPCSLISPLDMATITSPNPTFTWSPVGISAFPYGTIYSAESDLWVYDETADEEAWRSWFNNMTTSIATYNQDGQASPLIYGHNYRWNSWGYGYDINGDLIAASESEDWEFCFGEDIVYRALCVGVGDYINNDVVDDLLDPPYDVDRMRQTLGYCKFGVSNTGFSTINYLKDLQATKSNILQRIASTFSGADNNDISYFYFGGHGWRFGNTSYLCPTDTISSVDLDISVDELESALSAIPGTKVVFLDTCYSGGFIGKGKGEITISQEELESFNNEIINVFSQVQSKGLLITNQYKVLTACHYYQESGGIYPTVPGDFDPYGVFTMALCTGCGYFGSYPADTNLDTKVSLQEAYLYVKLYVQDLSNTYPYLNITQDVQIYPNNSTFTITEY